MAGIAKTIVATGVSSGLGFEAVKQLLEQSQPYRFIIGARNANKAQQDYEALAAYDASRHKITVLPLELSDLRGVRTFAGQALEALADQNLDYLMLNAAISNGSQEPGPHGSKWCEAHVVNHLSQHYLMHLFREKLVASHSRVVFVSSGAIRVVSDPSAMDNDLKGAAGVDGKVVYCQTKFANYLAAQWWRRQLQGQARIVAVSPGLIPQTGLSRGSGLSFSMDMPDAKSVPVGAASILAAFTRDDFPEDPEQIFLTSWGEWWSKDVYANALDKDLQDKWCPSKEQLEKEEGLAA